ncbi:MAG: flavodoxin domain-containing protein [Clostridia bacterium]
MNLINKIFSVGVDGCNAYLVQGAKSALIDGVRAEFTDEYISNIEKIMPVADIEYIILNHTGPENSGSVDKILELNHNIEVVGTIAAVKNLKEITNKSFNEHIAKDGAELDLGNENILKFIITPNLPWPDTMMTYLDDDKILFSCNAFSSVNDAVTDEKLEEDEFRNLLKIVYDDVISPFKPFMLKTTEKLLSRDIHMICPGKGMILKKYASEAIKSYKAWSRPTVRDRKNVIIFYASDYGNTASMAAVIEKTLTDCGVDVKSINVKTDKLPQTVTDADALIFGTSTINRNAAGEIWEAVSKIDLINMKNKPCFVFGSYGWGGEGLQILYNHMKLLKLKVFEKPFGCFFKPSEKDKKELMDYTKRFAESI